MYVFTKICMSQSTQGRSFHREERKGPKPRACPDTRLLAKGVSYQHIFGTTTAIEPVCPEGFRAAELQFDISACFVEGG
jgi:hypothetical protein